MLCRNYKQKTKRKLSLGEAKKLYPEWYQERVDAVDLEKPVAEGYVAQNPDLALASVALKVDDGDAKAVAMAKGNDKLKEAVNKVIKKLKDNGTYDEYIKDASKYTAVE